MEESHKGIHRVCLKSHKVGDFMENIVWINCNYEEDNRIFDSKRQAEVWADALLPDFGPYLISKTNVGYANPDEKVIKYLEYLLSKWADYNGKQL